MELDYANLSIDLISHYLTPLEIEIMTAALQLVSNISQKYFEKIIQYAYIFDAVKDHSPFLLNQNKIVNSEQVTYLNDFIKDYGEYQRLKKEDIQKAKELALKIREKYFVADKEKSAEKKRLMLVTQINRVFENHIPYHIKIKHALYMLEAKGLLQHKTIGKKTLWNVEPHFYQRLLEQQKQFTEENSLILKYKEDIEILTALPIKENK
ncbi:MAG: hypothetical protein RXP92_02655 [Candidatus Micrarchaeota archaeon]